MQSVWALVGIGMLGVISMTLWWSLARPRSDDLGLVSEQWLSEHRHTQSRDERG